MRTTLVLDDALLRLARKRAAELGSTVSEVVNQALREALARRPVPPAPFHMVTFGDPGQSVAHEPRDFADALEVDEREAPQN